MAVTATFLADFTTFQTAVDRATVKLKGLETGGTRVEKALSRMGDSFSGRRIVQDANLAVKAVEAIGGASKLTTREQERLNTMVTEALEKYRALGQVAPSSLVSMAEATKQVEKQMTLAQRATAALSGSLGQVAAGFALGNLLTAGIRGLQNFASEAVTTAGALSDASAKTGLTTDTLQQMAFAAEQAGGTLEDFTTASFKLGVNLAGGGKSVKAAVDALGLSFVDLSKLSPDQQFAQIATALGAIGDASERNRIGVELFGKSFAGIAAAIDKNYDDLIKKAPIAGAAQVKALDDAADAAKRFADALKAGSIGFAGNVILGFGKIVGSVEDAATAIHKYFADVETIMRAAGRAAGAIGPQPADIAAVKSYAEQLTEAQKAASSLSETQKKELNAALELGVAAAAELEEKFFEGLPGALDAYKKQQQDASEATKRHAEIMQRAADDIDKYVDKLIKARDELEKFRRTSDEMPDDPFAGMRVGVQEVLPSTPGLTAQEQRDLMLGTNRPGMNLGGFIPTVQQMQKYRKSAHEILTIWQEMTLDMAQYTSDAFGNMLTGIRSFKDGVTDIWRGLQQSVSRYISAIVNSWLSGVAMMGGASQGMGGFAPMGGGGGGLVGGGPGGSMLSMAGGGGGAGGGGWGGMTGYNQAVGNWARYGQGALVGGIAGFSAGYSSGSRWTGVGAGAASGALAGMGGGIYGIAIGAGVGAAAGFFGGSLGKSRNAKEVDAARRAYMAQFGPNGGWQVQEALGIFGSGNGSTYGTDIWRQFNRATTMDELNRYGVLIDAAVQRRASGAPLPGAPGPETRTPKGSIGGVPFYGNEAFGLKTPRLAVVGDAREPENVVKDSTLRKIAGGGTSDALERLVSRLERYIQDAPRVQARALSAALLQAGVTR